MKTVSAKLAKWRYPGPPSRYGDHELNRFFDRENVRLRAGRLTYEQWDRLPYHKRRLIANPEMMYWKNRLSNEQRQDQRRAQRTKRFISTARVSPAERRDASARAAELRASANLCTYCNHLVPAGRGHVDHVIPLSRGGLHIRVNLAASCAMCNHQKGALTGAEFRARKEADSTLWRTQNVNKEKSDAHPVYAAQNPMELSL